MSPKKVSGWSLRQACSVILMVLATFPFALTRAKAAEVVWTNAAGGLWSDASNWSPNVAPASSDNALITTEGTYAVTLDLGTTEARIILGAASGNQTLLWTNGTFAGRLTIGTNGILSIDGDSEKYVTGIITNEGTIRWAGAGALNIGLGEGEINNLAGGILDIQTCSTIGQRQ